MSECASLMRVARRGRVGSSRPPCPGRALSWVHAINLRDAGSRLQVGPAPRLSTDPVAIRDPKPTALQEPGGGVLSGDRRSPAVGEHRDGPRADGHFLD